MIMAAQYIAQQGYLAVWKNFHTSFGDNRMNSLVLQLPPLNINAEQVNYYKEPP